MAHYVGLRRSTAAVANGPLRTLASGTARCQSTRMTFKRHWGEAGARPDYPTNGFCLREHGKRTGRFDGLSNGRFGSKIAYRPYLDGEAVVSPSGMMYTDAACDGLLPLCSTWKAHVGHCDKPTSLNILLMSLSVAMMSS